MRVHGMTILNFKIVWRSSYAPVLIKSLIEINKFGMAPYLQIFPPGAALWWFKSKIISLAACHGKTEHLLSLKN